MENEETANIDDTIFNNTSAVNNSILEYYKKFGKKRDIEQFFSLSTAQSELKDTTGLFWKRMKAQNDSSDSGDKKSESSTELCRVSIRCSVPESSSSSHLKRGDTKSTSDTDSPPIVNEEVIQECNNSDNEIIKSDDDLSTKYVDAMLDTSNNRPLSPSSSITSQRKLEWDSMADVGYANESDRKNSASSLSTLERLALQQQYSNNDNKQNPNISGPTAHSTPVDQNESNKKGKKEIHSKTTKIYQKDVDFMELTVPQFTQNNMQPINVNLTKHISFNVERDGEVKIDITKKNSLSPEKVPDSLGETAQEKHDKEIQTTLPKSHNKNNELPKNTYCKQKFPVLISLNSLKKRNRKKRVRKYTRLSKIKLLSDKENISQEKGAVPLSDAESFEYMPGHIYKQSQLKSNVPMTLNVDNKSSLESSTGHTTESSKASQHSFSKDLEKSIDILKAALQHSQEDSILKKKLIKEVVQRLLKSKYKSDECSTGFLSGINFEKMQYNQTTSSTSDNNNSEANRKSTKPKKSILRTDNTFNPNPITVTSQSAPNLPSITSIDKPFESNLKKLINNSSTDSEVHIEKMSGVKSSSENLYKQYLEALEKEKKYKKHLKDKEIFLRQKLSNSEAIINVVKQNEIRSQNRLKDLISDLSRNNYDDGSGDASKLEYGSSSNFDLDKYAIRKHRSHSVFTLSSGNSETQSKNSKIKDRLQNEIHNSLADNKKKYCCCSSKAVHRKVGVIDSSVQVNIGCEKSSLHQNGNQHNKSDAGLKENSDKCSTKDKSYSKNEHLTKESTEDIKYVCLCADNAVSSHNLPENILIYKCSRLPNKCFMIGNNLSEVSSGKIQTTGTHHTASQKNNSPSSNEYNCDNKCLIIKDSSSNAPSSKSSQTNLNLPLILQCKSSERSITTSSESQKCQKVNETIKNGSTSKIIKCIQEATRCIQTEISIDPKISDPSMTDIKIIGDENIVKLVCTQHKEVSQPSSDIIIPDHHESSPKSFCNKKEKMTSPKVRRNQQDKEIQSCCDEAQNNVACQTINKIETQLRESDLNSLSQQKKYNSSQRQSSDNFTIPIQGTNMTLKVSLGSEGKPSSCVGESNVITCCSKAVETVKSEVVENYTSLQEECSKYVQSNNIDIIEQFNKETKSKFRDCNMNTEGESKTGNVSSQCNTINSCVTNKYKCNTYPKPSNTEKHLTRSNTDTGNMEKLAKKDANTQHDDFLKSQSSPGCKKNSDYPDSNKCCSTGDTDTSGKSKISTESCKKIKLQKKDSESDCCSKDTGHDPLLEMIQDITKRYSKKNIEKNKRKKCFKEIITVLNYLLNTEDNTENDQNILSSSASDEAINAVKLSGSKQSQPAKTFEDKSVQLSTRKSKCNRTCTESSDLPVSTDIPSTSDSATCKVLNKIKKECERYHQKRCKSHTGIKKCEPSSSTSVNCEQCKRIHYCFCRSHRCKNHKSKNLEKTNKKCVAYNLIIQTSDSFMSEEINKEISPRQLKNIIIKVPSKRKVESLPFKEMVSKLEKDNRCCGKSCPSRNLPNDSEISSTDDFIKKAQTCTVREYLEKNRPDFVDNSSKRQNCLKLINETRPTDLETPRLKMVVVQPPNCMGNNNWGSCNMYCGGVPMNSCNQGVDHYNNMHCIQSEVTRIAKERAAKRQLLSLQLDQQPTLASVSEAELRHLAEHFGKKMRTKKLAQKFLSERDMKKHSEKIYKTLPEVQRIKEEMKKENIKKTNLLMANIFKKNLQKKTLSGAVNISNYSAVIKI